MKKKVFVSLGIILSCILIYGAIKAFHKSDYDLLTSYWNVNIPNDSKIKLIHSSDRGPHGEGKRIYTLKTDKTKTNSTDLKCDNCNNKFSEKEINTINSILEFSKDNSDAKNINIDKDFKLIKTINHDINENSLLIITYNEKLDLYYLFEYIF